MAECKPQSGLGDMALELEIEWELEWEYGVDTDWENMWHEVGADNEYGYFRPRKPEGIAVVFYDGNDNDYYYNRELHLSASGGKIRLDDTTTAIMIYNDDSDYITLNNLWSPNTAFASTLTRNRTSRGSLEEYHAEEPTMNAPDLLYGAYCEIKDIIATKAEYSQTTKITLKPLVYSYVVKFYFDKNREYIAEAHGMLAGMAENIYIKDGHKSESKAIIPFSGILTSYGIGAQIVTFGTPESCIEENGNSLPRHDIILDVLLTNGKTVTFDFDITEQLIHQPTGGVITLDNISISDEDVAGSGSSSGFIPEVEEWEENHDVTLPI